MKVKKSLSANKLIGVQEINDFLKKYGDFSAKNFRTWTANEYFIKHLYYILSDTPDLNKLSEKMKLGFNELCGRFRILFFVTP